MLLSFFPASLERQEQAVSPCQPRLGPGPAPRRRPRKRRPIYKVAPLTVSTARRTALIPLDASTPLAAPVPAPVKREESEKKQDSCSSSSDPISSEGSVLPPQSNPVTVNNTHGLLLNQLKEPQLLEVICTVVHINKHIYALICDLKQYLLF